MSQRTQKVEIHLANDIAGLVFVSVDLEHFFADIDGKEFGLMVRGKGPHKPKFDFNIVRIHSFSIYTNLFEYNIVRKTKAPLLRCFPVFSKLKAGDLLITGQYLDIVSLQFRSKYFR